MSDIASDRAPLGGVSHVKGPTLDPLLKETIPQLLRRISQTYPDSDAAIFPAQSIRKTYAEFSEDVDRLATALLKLGFTKDDRIGILSPNRYEWLLTQFATAQIGVILVNVNPAYRVFELEYAVNKVGCKGLILAPNFKSSDYVAMMSQIAPKLPSDRLPMLTTLICMGDTPPPGHLSFDQIMADCPTPDLKALEVVNKTLNQHDPINIQFTSGTTGRPKGATLTHHNIINNAHFTTMVMGFTSKDRLCIPVPFYHCFGMVMGTLGCVTKGAAMVVPGEGFDPIDTLRAVSQENCTALYAVPTMFVGMLEHPDFANYDLSTLRTGIMAGAPCPIEIMRSVQSKMHMEGVTIAYGMTETSPVSFQSNPDDPVEKRCTSVGRIHPHVEVKIVDETGATVPIGEQGELWTRGYSVMQGYWDEAEQTSETIDTDGWLHTGDLARIDKDGFANITGRVKDMIVRGGENIYPREVEEFLYTHPAVSQVQVFGIPDPKYGEIACTWIITKPGQAASEDEIRDFCRASIAHYKVPALVRFVDDIPMTVTGKPQKFAMRDVMIAELGLTQDETA